MALFKPSSSGGALALLLAALLLLSAAASAVAQALPPPEPEEDEEPQCPVNINDIIVDALKFMPLPADGSSQEAIDELSTSELAACVCDNIVSAAGITGATPAAIDREVTDVIRTLGRPIDLNLIECNATVPAAAP